jgi:hypothetical protein
MCRGFGRKSCGDEQSQEVLSLVSPKGGRVPAALTFVKNTELSGGYKHVAENYAEH